MKLIWLNQFDLLIIVQLFIAIIPLQHGTNKFATQKGVKIGASRDILPKVKDISHKESMKQWTEQQLRASDGKLKKMFFNCIQHKVHGY